MAVGLQKACFCRFITIHFALRYAVFRLLVCALLHGVVIPLVAHTGIMSQYLSDVLHFIFAHNFAQKMALFHLNLILSLFNVILLNQYVR